MKKVALIVAGGDGKRMNSDVPKQFLHLNNRPILLHTIKKFSHFDKIILVLPEKKIDYWNQLCQKFNFNKNYILVKGGKNRFYSVKNGLEKINEKSIVAIHDGVRPLVSKHLIDNLISQTKEKNGVVPVVPVKNSIRKVKGLNSIFINRDDLYQVQTPQCFISSDIKDAYNQEFTKKFTDDAVVFEANGGKISTILGEEKNLKITTIEDLKIANIFMQ